MVRRITTVLPDPVSVIPWLLFAVVSVVVIFKIFATGTAVPLSVTKLVGTLGGTGPVAVLFCPA